MSDEAAQPAEGQGAEAPEGNDLYGSFLEGIPDNIHDQVIPALKAQDAEFTKRFQSLSERTRPFEEAGVFDADPESIGAYLTLDQAVNAAQEGDPEAREAVQEWWDQMGEALGFYETEEGEMSEGGDESLEDFDPYDPESFKRVIAEMLDERVAPIAEHLQEREYTEAQQQALAEAEASIEAQVAELKESNPDLSDDDLAEILTMAELFADEDNPVAAGFEKYQSLVGKGENRVFDSKVGQPSVPESGGNNPSLPVEATSANVRDLVKERLNAAQSIG